MRPARLSRPVLALALAAAVLPSCGGGGGGGSSGPVDTFDREALLTRLATALVMPTYEDLVAKATALANATQAYASEVEIDGLNKATLLTAARDAWKDMMAVAEVAELLQFGPAGVSTEIVAGQNLRLEIHSWPTSNPCRVDQEIVSKDYENPAFFDTELVNVYGLDAMEYLLFHTGTDNACAITVDINTGMPSPWEGVSDLELRRANYAAACAADVLARAEELLNEWETSGDDFLTKFTNASTSGVYPNAHAAANDVFAAMFYLDTMVKDKKLGRPAGLTGEPLNPDNTESHYSTTSKDHLLKNLETFQFMFLGRAAADPETPGTTVGFDDWLVERGASTLADTMTADIAAAITAVIDIPGTLEAALGGSPADVDKVEAAHAAVKKITDNLKSQFVTVLNLSLPQTGAGDND